MKLLLAVLVAVTMLGSSGPVIAAEEATVQNGKTVSFEYTLTVDNKVVDSSKGKQPLEYVHGDGKMLPGLSKQLDGMKIGQEKTVTLPPEDAYGMPDPAAMKEVPIASLPKNIKPEPGLPIQAKYANGQVAMVRIAEVKKDSVLMDLNHPLAGKTLIFNIKIIGIK